MSFKVKKSGVFGKPITPFLFMFTDQQRHALLATLDRLAWNSTWVDDDGNSDPLTDSQQSVIDDIYLQLARMESMDSIAAAIEYLADKLQFLDNGGCCETVSTDDGLPQDPDTTPYDGAGDPPEGFGTWEEYYDARCKDANWYADSLIDGMRGVDSMSNAVLTGLTMAAVLAIMGVFFPPAWMGVATGVILAAAATQLLIIGATIGFDAFGELADYWETNKQDLVCSLYDWDTGLQLTTALIQKVYDDMISLGYSAGDAQTISDFFDKFFSGEVLNYYVANIGQNAPLEYVGPLSCDGCIQPPAPDVYIYPNAGTVWDDTGTTEPRLVNVGQSETLRSYTAAFGNEFIDWYANDAIPSGNSTNYALTIDSTVGWATMNNNSYTYTLQTRRVGEPWVIVLSRGADLQSVLPYAANCRQVAVGGGVNQWTLTFTRTG